MLVISDQEVQALLPMDECIQATEEAYREVATGAAQNLPRARARTDIGDSTYTFTFIAGLLPSRGVMAVRLDSSAREPDPERETRYLQDRFTGWLVLFSLKTGEPLAIINEFSLSGARVGATVGLGMKYLARRDASRVALYGTGKQARTNLEGVSKIRRLEQVKVYSPNPAHRLLFADEMGPRLGVEIVPVDGPEKAIEGADIVLCASNSSAPVFDGHWLQPGMSVCCISWGLGRTSWGPIEQKVARWEVQEIDDLTIECSDRIIVVSKDQAVRDRQRRLWDPEAPNGPNPKVAELTDVLLGKAPGRQADQEITLFANNTGSGIQFAAAGAIVYDKARASGVGHEVPTDWLMTDLRPWAEKGFFPSP